MKLKFYHTSGTRFKVGDIIGGPGKKVFLHTKPIPHGTIQEIVKGGFKSWEHYENEYYPKIDEYWDKREHWNKTQEGDKPEYPEKKSNKPVNLYVYEMKPFSKPVFVGVNDEYVAIDIFVEVVKIVGNAKGILENFKKKFGDGSKAYYFGGAAQAPKGRRRLNEICVNNLNKKK